jgi:hypothetical protein
VQGGKGLLLDGFDGDGMDVLVAIGLEEALSVGSVGFVATDVGSDVLRWEKNDVVSELLELSGPAMSHAASLHHDVRWGSLREEAKKPRAAEAMGFRHSPRAMGNRNLEDVLCNIYGNRRMLHFRTPPFIGSMKPYTTLALRCR